MQSGRGHPAMAGARLPPRGCGERQENMGVIGIISSPVVGVEEREPAFLQERMEAALCLATPA